MATTCGACGANGKCGFYEAGRLRPKRCLQNPTPCQDPTGGSALWKGPHEERSDTPIGSSEANWDRQCQGNPISPLTRPEVAMMRGAAEDEAEEFEKLCREAPIGGKDKEEEEEDPEPEEETAGANGAGGAAEEENDEEEEEAQGRCTPCLPTIEVQRRHNRNHIPFRSWCKYCVQGRLQHGPHVGGAAQRREPGALPEVHMDYAFFRNEQAGESVPVLVLKERDSKALSAHVVPFKGATHGETVDQCIRDIKKWGLHGDLILKSDQEAALVSLVTEIIRERTANDGVQTLVRTLREESAVEDSQGNGVIESGVKSLEGLVRTLKFALEDRLQEKIDVSDMIFYWLVEHAADLLTKFQRGKDGATPWERLKMKAYKGETYEFGSLVHHHVPGKTRGGSSPGDGFPVSTSGHDSLLRSTLWRWRMGAWLRHVTFNRFQKKRDGMPTG